MTGGFLMMNRAVSLSLFIFVLLSLWLKVSDGDSANPEIFAHNQNQELMAERLPASVEVEEARY